MKFKFQKSNVLSLTVAVFLATLVSPLSLAVAAEPEKPADKSAAKTSTSAPGLTSKSKSVEVDTSPGYAHTKLFGIEAEGSKFVYVFDRSGSMSEYGGRPLKEAKKQLLGSLNDLNERHQFYIVFYNEQPRLFSPGGGAKGRLVFATPENKREGAQFVDSIQADGGTDHMSALSIAIRLRPDVIFLLTDGESQDDLTADDLKRVDRLNGGNAKINVIQFAPSPRPDSTLVKLAKQNRGQHVFVDLDKLGESKPADAAKK